MDLCLCAESITFLPETVRWPLPRSVPGSSRSPPAQPEPQCEGLCSPSVKCETRQGLISVHYVQSMHTTNHFPSHYFFTQICFFTNILVVPLDISLGWTDKFCTHMYYLVSWPNSLINWWTHIAQKYASPPGIFFMFSFEIHIFDDEYTRVYRKLDRQTPQMILFLSWLFTLHLRYMGLWVQEQNIQQTW